MNNIIIPQAVQICLRDLDVLVPQQAGNRIEVCSHLDLLLGEEMATGMRRNPNTFYTRSVALYDVFDRRICQLPPMKGKKIVIVGILQGKVSRRAVVVFEQHFPQNRRNRDNSLLVVFSVDDNKIIVNILLSDAAQFPTADSSLK